MQGDAATADAADMPALSREEALELTRRGGSVLCLELPTGHEFGLDLRIYRTGPRFRGMKMVPHGLHLAIFGTEIDRTGLFVRFAEEGGVRVLQWDPKTELLSAEAVGPEERERHAAAVRSMEHDTHLGPYPLGTHAEWQSLCAHIDDAVLERAGIPVGVFVAPGADDVDALLAPSAPLRPYFGELPRTAQWVEADPYKLRRAAAAAAAADPSAAAAGPASTWAASAAAASLVGEALTRFALDRSEWLETLLATAYGGGQRAEPALLGELELAFLLFLQLSSLGALEQWKLLVHTLCACSAALHARTALYLAFLPLLQAQLRMAPADFFDDPLTGDNFLRSSLSSLIVHAQAQQLPLALEAALSRFFGFLKERFGVDLEAEQAWADEEAEDGEDAPVVVYPSELGGISM